MFVRIGLIARSTKQMSGSSVEACANCGKGPSEAARLKNCTACRLVKYCSVDCQMAHRKQHKGACKKCAAELKDERLYTQGLERPEEDFCPISGFRECCMKKICFGCHMAAQKSGMNDCPFCRTSINGRCRALASVQKRVDAKDPVAIDFLAGKYYFGEMGLEKNVPRAIELWKEAAELGSIEAHLRLGYRYYNGEGVEQNLVKSVQHWEKAACQGCTDSRRNLGDCEHNNGNYQRAVRHLLISVKMGDNVSLETIKQMFAKGHATKDQYAEALKGYRNSLNETESPEREMAKAKLRPLPADQR